MSMKAVHVLICTVRFPPHSGCQRAPLALEYCTSNLRWGDFVGGHVKEGRDRPTRDYDGLVMP